MKTVSDVDSSLDAVPVVLDGRRVRAERDDTAFVLDELDDLFRCLKPDEPVVGAFLLLDGDETHLALEILGPFVGGDDAQGFVLNQGLGVSAATDFGTECCQAGEVGVPDGLEPVGADPDPVHELDEPGSIEVRVGSRWG